MYYTTRRCDSLYIIGGQVDNNVNYALFGNPDMNQQKYRTKLHASTVHSQIKSP